jgi:hypothetical protein
LKQALHSLFSALRSRRLLVLAGSLLVATLLGGGCGNSSSATPDTCDEGSEGCGCKPDTTCDSGLTCASSVCVFVAASGGTGATGAGGDTSSGGSGNATSSGGTKGRIPTTTDTKPDSHGGGATTGCDCGADAPVCDPATDTCKVCTPDEGCSGATPVCDTKRNDMLGECVAEETGEGGASNTGVPAEWTCLANYYGDSYCDCGCGALDTDCDSITDTCQWCGGCSSDATCPGLVDPEDNSQCVVNGWTCAAALYGNGSCDCGCGDVDSDCANELGSSCTSCVGCNGSGCPGLIDQDDNGVCVESDWSCVGGKYGDGVCDCGCTIPDPDCANADLASCATCCGGTCPGIIDPEFTTACNGWTCNPSWYGDNACDCGCGIVDVDCADALVGSCAFCLGCSTGGCPGMINPTNNAVCGQ